MKGLLNRDISWLSFNQRVSDEASKKSHTLAEQVMFHSITGSNLTEFLKVRYPAALEENEINDKLIEAIGDHYKKIINRWRKFNKEYDLVRPVKDLSKDQKKWLEKYFDNNIFPAILPVESGAHIYNGLYLMVETVKNDQTYYGYIEIPKNIDRFIVLPKKKYCVKIEDVVEYFIDHIYHGCDIKAVAPFCISRSAEVYDLVDKSLNPYDMIKETLQERERSWITCLEIQTDKKRMFKAIQNLIPIKENTLIFATDWVRLADIKSIPSEVYKEDEQMRKLKPIKTFPSNDIFDYIKKKDRLCLHPYESYEHSFVKFITEAAKDKDVVSIRICLYRVSEDSKIIDAILKAADNGKQVTCLIELKARFDEKHNMEIANILKQGGVRIVYTKPDIKTHAKVCLVTRKEKKGLRVYSHIGTGNYSEANSKLYTDYSYFTADTQIGKDLTRFFNLLTSNQGDFKSKKILYAPYNLRDEIVDNINNQIKRAKDKKHAQIIVKCNSLTDPNVAEKLIEAAKSGVEVKLIIRSACIIQPQKNISIYSIVGDQLEHFRCMIFGTGKEAIVMIGSSDLMTRNLSRRNEVMLVVEPDELRKRIIGHIKMYLRDNQCRRRILPDYKYEDIKPKKGEKAFNVQKALYKEAKELAR